MLTILCNTICGGDTNTRQGVMCGEIVSKVSTLSQHLERRTRITVEVEVADTDTDARRLFLRLGESVSLR